jgi:hypothetical protein
MTKKIIALIRELMEEKKRRNRRYAYRTQL